MNLFSRPVASVYVKELRTRLDPLVVPVFTPDTSIEVGDFGSFEGGRFVRHGNVRDRGVVLDVDDQRVSGFDFASAGKVTIGPAVSVPSPTGGDLLKATIEFSKSRAVVVSFKPGVEAAVRDADAFGDTLMRLWLGNLLRRDRAVVWSVRRADGGTVIASEEGRNSLEVMADSAVLGPAGLTVPNLALGVKFGTEQKATWKLSEPDAPMVAWVRLLRIGSHHAQDAFGFEPGSDELESAVAGASPEPVSLDELIDHLDTEQIAPLP